MPRQLQLLQYPYTVKKSDLFNIGAPNAWPSLLAALCFLSRLCFVPPSFMLHIITVLCVHNTDQYCNKVKHCTCNALVIVIYFLTEASHFQFYACWSIIFDRHLCILQLVPRLRSPVEADCPLTTLDLPSIVFLRV